MTDLFDAAGPLREAYRRVDWAATPLGPMLRGRQHLSAEQLCDHLLAHFGAGTEDDVVLAIVRAEPSASPDGGGPAPTG